MVNVLEAVRSLEPLIRAHADEAEAARRYPRRVIKAMAEAGVFRMLVPHVAGGEELDPLTLLDVVEEVSRVDGSAGWVAMIGSGAGFITGFLSAEVGRQIFADPLGCLCGNLGAPNAHAELVPGGYRVTGRWPFVSGCEHSTWWSGLAIVGDTPRIMVFPRADGEIIDAWADVCAGRAVDGRQRAILRLAMTHAVQASAEAVDLMWTAGGGSPIYTSSPLERCFRDIHVATQHAAVATLSWETIGKALFDPALGAQLI